jgi:hypothetical protein
MSTRRPRCTHRRRMRAQLDQVELPVIAFADPPAIAAAGGSGDPVSSTSSLGVPVPAASVQSFRTPMGPGAGARIGGMHTGGGWLKPGEAHD